MVKDKFFNSALNVQKGIEQPKQVNESALSNYKKKKQSIPSVDEFVSKISDGNRIYLSKAITLIESLNEQHKAMAQEIIERCLPLSGNSLRIGITGVPGAGKSTFIESFGEYLTSIGKKIAVLAIDPSSQKSKGSILGDKTRMERLSVNPDAFIRPSPSAGTLGGVARKTRESIVLCEAAGFDIIIIETVGVGQSEIAARSMVDFFILLQISGAGDELQGIKRGIMEMVDAVFVNKAEGDNLQKAKLAAAEIKNALHLMPAQPSNWTPEVGLCSALHETGIEDVWKTIVKYIKVTKENDFFELNRKNQEMKRLELSINELLQSDFYNDKRIIDSIENYRKDIFSSKISPYSAAQKLVDLFYSK